MIIFFILYKLIFVNIRNMIIKYIWNKKNLLYSHLQYFNKNGCSRAYSKLILSLSSWIIKLDIKFFISLDKCSGKFISHYFKNKTFEILYLVMLSLSPVNGAKPVESSNVRTPKLQTSIKWEYGFD